MRYWFFSTYSYTILTYLYICLLHISIGVCVFTEHNAEKGNFVILIAASAPNIQYSSCFNIRQTWFIVFVIRGRERESLIHTSVPLFSYRFQSLIDLIAQVSGRCALCSQLIIARLLLIVTIKIASAPQHCVFTSCLNTNVDFLCLLFLANLLFLFSFLFFVYLSYSKDGNSRKSPSDHSCPTYCVIETGLFKLRTSDPSHMEAGFGNLRAAVWM